VPSSYRAGSPTPPSPDPAVLAGRRREASELRSAAQQLRHRATASRETLRTLEAYDRPDVWYGRRADHVHAEVVEAVRRLTSPWAGALDGIAAAAVRMDARAAALEATSDGPSW
jgi:hypothetical protein